MNEMFRPFGRVSKLWKNLIVIFWVCLAGIIWCYPPDLLYFVPSPQAVSDKFFFLYESGLIEDLVVSLKVIFEAGLIALPVGALLAYLYECEFFKPPIILIAGLSNLGPLAVIAACLYMGFSGMEVKVYTMTFVILVYFLSALLQNRPTQDDLDLARTMHMTPWQSLWHVTIRGRLYDTLRAFIPNLAMGWAMLSVVEGANRDAGGLGDVMLKQDKISSMAGIAVISIISLAFGLLIRFALKKLIDWRFPAAARMNVRG